MGLWRYLIKRKILNALVKKNEEVGYWLSIANEGILDEEAFKFQYNGKSLVELALNEHLKAWKKYKRWKNPKDSLEAQDYLMGILTLWKEQSALKPQPKQPFSLFERFMLWQLGTPQRLPENPFSVTQLPTYLERLNQPVTLRWYHRFWRWLFTPKRVDEVSYPEKYQPDALLEKEIRGWISPPHSEYKFVFEASKKRVHAPITHIHHYEQTVYEEKEQKVEVGTEKELNLVTQQETQQKIDLQQQLSLNDQVEQELNNQIWVDASERVSYQYALDQLQVKNMGTLFDTVAWLTSFKNYYPNKPIQISDCALEILKNGHYSIKNKVYDPKQLPLGFFIEQQADQTILSFDPQLRSKQLTLSTCSLRDDPAQRRALVNMEVQFVTAAEVIPFIHFKDPNQQTEFLSLCDALNLDFTLDHDKSGPDQPKVGVLVFKALKIMLDIAGEDAEKYDKVLHLVTLLMELNKKQFRYQKKLTLLEVFAQYYLQDPQFACDFFEAETYAHKIHSLKQLLQIKDDNELAWFYELSAIPTRQPKPFLQNTQGLFYFLNYFKQIGPLPNRGLGRKPSRFGIPHLKKLLNCIDSIQNPHNRLLQFQLLDEMPENIEKIQELLRKGYCIVHEQMFVENLRLPDLISKPDFMRLEYQPGDPNYYWAYFLRFAAKNLDSEALAKFIKEHQPFFQAAHDNNFRILGPLLNKEWDNLKKQVCPEFEDRAALRISKRHSPEEKVEQSVLRLDIFPLRYEEEHVASLFERLNLEPILTANLKRQIKQLDSISGPLTFPLKDNNLIHRLALIRALNQQASPPKNLRLEQLVSVLLLMQDNCLLEVATGEGKTLIIQIASLLQALDGKKVNVITHNKQLAEESHDGLEELAKMLGLKIAKKTNIPEEIVNADIYFVDISTAVIDDALASIPEESKQKRVLAGHRQADVQFVDEADAVAIDIHSRTSHQIAKQQVNPNVSPPLEAFLRRLNGMVRAAEKLSDESIRVQLQNDPYYQDHINQFEGWLTAAKTASHLVKGVDYVLEPEPGPDGYHPVNIMCWDTNGRKQEHSVYDSGIHACIAAWEKHLHAHMKISIPSPSKVIATGQVAKYLQKTKSCSGLTATPGDSTLQGLIKNILRLNTSVRIPIAKRDNPQEEGFMDWQYVKGKKVYSRRYDFAPIITKTREEHLTTLLKACAQAQANQQALNLYFNTSKECELFFQDAKTFGLNLDLVQILDDTVYKAGTLRPPEATVIRQARAGMITLTTATGGRGTDWDVKTHIIPMPGMNEVTLQKKGRGGRRGLGVTYEVYCVDDLTEETQILIKNKQINGLGPRSRISHDLRALIKPTEKSMRAPDIAKLASMRFYGEKDIPLIQDAEKSSTAIIQSIK